jgi:hypothetical protein
MNLNISPLAAAGVVGMAGVFAGTGWVMGQMSRPIEGERTAGERYAQWAPRAIGTATILGTLGAALRRDPIVGRQPELAVLGAIMGGALIAGGLIGELTGK